MGELLMFTGKKTMHKPELVQPLPELRAGSTMELPQQESRTRKVGQMLARLIGRGHDLPLPGDQVVTSIHDAPSRNYRGPTPQAS